GHVAAELSRFAAMLAPFGDEFSVGRKFLDPAVPLVGDIQETIRPEGDRSGKLELAIPRSLLPPLPQQFAGRRICRHFVAVPVRDVDVSLRINRQAARMRLNRKRADELAFRREPLHALVAEFGGVDIVVLPDGDADARAEFSLLFA